MVVSLLVVGFIAWAMTGAVEDTIRAARGDAPAGPRKGFRGYLDDRWQALADRHHASREAGLLSAGDSWAHRRHLARKRALARAGYATDEDIARAAWHHRRRLGLINEGIDPDTVPDPPGAPAPKRRRTDPHGKYKPAVPETKSKEALDTTDVVGLTDLDQTKPAAKETADTDPQAKPWTPFTNPKENDMTAGEINNPADVKAFAAAMTNSLNTTGSTIDTLDGIATGLAARIADHTANAKAAETAAAGMDSLGMTDAAAAARSLIEQQRQIEASMLAIVEAIQTHTASITDQVEAARRGVAAIGRAYAAQLAVADTRAGVGRGNLAADAYLDGDV